MKGEPVFQDSCLSPLGRLQIYLDQAGRLLQLSPVRKPGGLAEGVIKYRSCSLLKMQLAEYFAGQRTDFSIELQPAGTAFQQAVWEVLRHVAYGSTSTYQAIAAQLGRPLAARAVGNAVGANRILILIPCHRIIKSSGEPGGFSCGTDKKKILLQLEKEFMSLHQQ